MLLLTLPWLAACGSDTDPPGPTQAPSVAESTADVGAQAALRKWARSCVLCHVGGEGGAPRMGNADDWGPRIARGEDAMVANAIAGYNNMPPLGYCMDCEEADFRYLTRHMADLP